MSTERKYRRLDPAQRRDQMLDAANDLFAERGYEEVSVEDIARAAGVTREELTDELTLKALTA